MNDPNGLIKIDGTYHLFFQHDPDSIDHGPMHWGHASSVDLMTWAEHPVALRPNGLGTCFSGSAIETDEGNIKLFYTAHRHAGGQDLQVQCVVHADRGLEQFLFDAQNPVVPNPGLPAFRDPKVIWHAQTRRWIMLVTEGQSIGFYASSDLIGWVYLSSFGEGHGRHSSGPWECPDMVPMATPNGSTAWVLIVGLNPGGYAPGSGTQYFVGHFDGSRFTNANSPETELWLDHGRDYYAAQTFFDRERLGGPVAVAWASNWLYAKQTPTKAFRGVMSLPRELFLAETRSGLRVGMRLPSSVSKHLGDKERAGTGSLAYLAELAVGDALAIELFGESHPQFVVRRDTVDRGSIQTLRRGIAGTDGFEHDYSVEVDWPTEQPLGLTAVVDRGLVELSTDDGLVWITNVFYPQQFEEPSLAESSPAGQGELFTRVR